MTDLTPSQAQEIFCGQQMSWSHGGSITAFAPPAVMSSARECFEQTTPEQRPIGRQIRLESEPFIPEQVAQRPGAIGLLMAGAATLDPRIKVLRVGGVVPSPQTILDKTYPLSRTLVFTARPKLSSDAQAFIDFVFSEQGQQIIHDAGFLPLSTNTDSMPQTAGVSTDAASEPGQ